MYDLQGKVALVTGAGGEQGIGRAIAMRLAAEGADVVVNDLSERASATDGWSGMAQVVQDIQELGRRCLGIAADVADAEDVQAMVDESVRALGQIDILVNNAGARASSDRVPVVELSEADWDRVQRVNVKGTFLVCRAVARAMLARGQGGKIINISSTAGKIGMARYAAYCSSKFAVRGFTQTLALELAPHGINVNAICPSLIATERIEDMATILAPQGTSPVEQRRAMVAQAAQQAPLGRMAETDDIAAMAAFLSSAESDYLTGLSISVSGGLQMY